MTKTYTLTLVNKDKSLNLAIKGNEIQDVIDNILSGGNTGDAFQDVRSIKIIPPIGTHTITLEVDESGDNWHRWFGKKLASDDFANMRNYCDVNDETNMFEAW